MLLLAGWFTAIARACHGMLASREEEEAFRMRMVPIDSRKMRIETSRNRVTCL
jgi:hypothetical protein